MAILRGPRLCFPKAESRARGLTALEVFVMIYQQITLFPHTEESSTVLELKPWWKAFVSGRLCSSGFTETTGSWTTP